MKLLSLAILILVAAPLAYAATRGEYPPPIDRSASRAAQAAQRTVQNEVSAANSKANTIASTLRKDMEQIPSWQEATADSKRATADYEGGKKVVMERLKNDTIYKSAVAARAKAEAELEKVKADQGDVFAAATKTMNAGNAVSRIEGDAFAADAAVSDARKRMLEAKAKMDEMAKLFDEEIRSDETWLAARKEVAALEEKLAAARQATSQALAQEAQMERQRQDQIRQIDQAYAEALRQEREQNRNTYNGNRRR